MRPALILAAALLLVCVALLAVHLGPSPGQDQRLTISVGGESYNLAARVYRPSGPGPFPLVVINHGIPVRIDNIRQETPGFARAAQWFEARGYMVVVALRPGFGSSDGPYLEDGGDCRTENYVDLADRTGDIESAIVRSAAALPGADAQRIVVVGQSAGGLGAIALADVPPPGVVGVINFAGGRGGDDQEHICGGADRLAGTAATLGQENQLPQLWLYAANDHFFAPPVAHAMVAGYQARSPVPVRFVDLPAFADDGHNTFAQADPAIWAPPVTAFLQDLGLPAS